MKTCSFMNSFESVPRVAEPMETRASSCKEERMLNVYDEYQLQHVWLIHAEWGHLTCSHNPPHHDTPCNK